MPTGYTANVANGKITSLKDYIESCIPAFMIYFRDMQNINVREPLKFDFYCTNALAEAEKKYADFMNSSEEEKSILYKEYIDDRFEYIHRRIEENKEVISRYKNMLSKLANFKSPSEAHDKFVEFLSSQLHQSIEYDDVFEMYEDELDICHKMSFEKYVKNKEQDLLDDIAYYKKESIREQESANQNVQWLSKILEAIDAIDEPEETEEARQTNLVEAAD